MEAEGAFVPVEVQLSGYRPSRPGEDQTEVSKLPLAVADNSMTTVSNLLIVFMWLPSFFTLAISIFQYICTSLELKLVLVSQTLICHLHEQNDNK